MKQRTLLILVVTVLLLATASGPYAAEEKKMESNKHKYTNHLAKESSPYLLMHANNPVDWYPWGEAALEKAKKENKLIIISIGYAACHWCHVMEHESFEDEEVAALMNKYFVSVKVDREERPDIDQVYMDAAQILTGGGGWPLNAIALPDGRPFFAGTYFPKDKWMAVLKQIHQIYVDKPEIVVQQAEALTKGIRSSGAIVLNAAKPEFNPALPKQMFSRWETLMDYDWGGERRAPKFPLPIGYRFLMKLNYLTGNVKSLEAVKVTLDRMAMGGIYDQAGGGFARYSTDSYWKVPHFEKMLYDNSQLVSLYAYAYQLTKDPLYKTVVYETLDFTQRELTTPELASGGRGFYSSLDADSEGEEGKFYVWSKSEIQSLLGKDAPLIMAYYNISEKGNWEHGKNILFRITRDKDFAAKQSIDEKKLQEKVKKANNILLAARSKRVRPPLDDKVLTAWNALMLTGYVDAYRVFDEKRFLDRALDNAAFILKKQMANDGRLNRNFKDGVSSINAFLDDYAFTIEAFIALYQATFDEQWLYHARKLLDYTLVHFYDEKSGMFFYTSDKDPALIARKMEVNDNVIPSSNSRMGLNLYLLGEYFYEEAFIKKARQMLNNVKDDLVRGGPYYANWGLLLTYFTHPPAEVAIIGEDWEKHRKELDKHFLPHVLLMGGNSEGKLPLLEDKLQKGRTMIYVCVDKACQRPVTETKDALEQIKR